MNFKSKILSALEAFKSLTPALLPIFLSDVLLVHISDIEQFQNSLFGFISQPHLELKSMHEKIAKAHGPLGSRFLERLRNPILSL